jgi:hypothetical protein
MQFLETPQKDGSIRRKVEIYDPKSLDHNPRPPIFAGTFWEERTKRFITDHAGQGQRKADQVINGVRCQVWEWPVAHTEVSRAFGGWSDVTKDGGAIRLCVAPELGCVFPRVEHVGVGGASGTRYDSTGFHEVAPGLFLPTVCKVEYCNSKGVMSTFEYRIEKAEKINEPLPDSDFAIQLPVGTDVFDNRPGHEATYTISEDLPLSTTGLNNVEVIQPPSVFRRNRAWAITVGAALGVAILAAVWWRRRKMSRLAGGRS